MSRKRKLTDFDNVMEMTRIVTAAARSGMPDSKTFLCVHPSRFALACKQLQKTIIILECVQVAMAEAKRVAVTPVDWDALTDDTWLHIIRYCGWQQNIASLNTRFTALFRASYPLHSAYVQMYRYTLIASDYKLDHAMIPWPTITHLTLSFRYASGVWSARSWRALERTMANFKRLFPALALIHMDLGAAQTIKDKTKPYLSLPSGVGLQLSNQQYIRISHIPDMIDFYNLEKFVFGYTDLKMIRARVMNNLFIASSPTKKSLSFHYNSWADHIPLARTEYRFQEVSLSVPSRPTPWLEEATRFLAQRSDSVEIVVPSILAKVDTFQTMMDACSTASCSFKISVNVLFFAPDKNLKPLVVTGKRIETLGIIEELCASRSITLLFDAFFHFPNDVLAFFAAVDRNLPPKLMIEYAQGGENTCRAQRSAQFFCTYKALAKFMEQNWLPRSLKK